jgi:hypothetical protein
LRALARGQYAPHRVFFADEPTAVAAGYRPCAVCLPDRYARWKGDRGPLLTAREVAAHAEPAPPAPHTARELAAVLDLLTDLPGPVHTVAVGHSRDPASRAAADAVTTAWTARGGVVPAVVSWPERAASWLRPATRLTAAHPDAWVVAAAPLGFAQLARRLRQDTDWSPARTVGFAALGDPALPALTGPDVLTGLRGATRTGQPWHHTG